MALIYLVIGDRINKVLHLGILSPKNLMGGILVVEFESVANDAIRFIP